jgi:tape measure domain-containing protein
MVGLDYVINLVQGNFMSGMKAAKSTTKGLDDAVGKVDTHTQGLAKSSKQGFGGMVKWAKRAAIATGLVFGLGQAMAFGQEVTNVTAKMEGYNNAITFASGADGAKNLQFLDKTIKDLNLDMNASFGGFQSITGAMRGTKLEGQATRDIFEGVGMAATVMNLKADQVQGAFLAIGQIASKGKLQAEELRGQLGERIPGAFAIASRAMGVTQVEMNKLLEGGKIYAEDFLPKFAKELKKTFEGGLPAAANSMQAAINKKNNALLSFKNALGTFFRPSIIGIMKLQEVFASVTTNLLPNIQNLLGALEPIRMAFINVANAAGGTAGITETLGNIMNNLATVVNIAANGIGFLIENYKIAIPVIAAAIVVKKAYAIAQIAAATGTSFLTVATHGLNAAIKANPIGFAIGLIIALVGVVKTAYEKVGWFRGGVKAAWEGMKQFGIVIKSFVIDRIKQMVSGITGIGKTLMLFFKGEWKQAWETGQEAVKNLTGIGVGNAAKLADGMRSVGKKASEAYHQGVSEVDAKKKAESGQSALKSFTGTNAGTFGGTGTKTNAPKLSAGVSGGGSGAAKNITFNIQSLVKELKIQPQTLKEGAQDVEKQVKDIFIRLVRDVELQTS